MALINVIRTSHIFEGLPEGGLEKLTAICTEQSYQGGQAVFREGEEAENLYILAQGKIVLEMRIDLGPYRPPTHATVDVVTSGESFGWSAVVEPHVYTLSAICVDPSRVVAVKGAPLRELLDQDPPLGYQVMKRLARLISSRLMHTRQMLISERGLALL